MVEKYSIEGEPVVESSSPHLYQENESFGRRFRLHDRHEFLRFFQKSQRISLSACVIYRISNSIGHYRLGMTFKPKMSSVQRVKMKRLIREWFRQHSELLGAYDYNVVIPRQKKIDPLFVENLKHCVHVQLPKHLEKLTWFEQTGVKR